MVMCIQFAAEFAEKTLFKLVMARLLKDTVSCSASFCSMLSEVMLAVDQQLLDVSKLIGDQSGMLLSLRCLLCYRPSL